jgi:hypothetical protein
MIFWVALVALPLGYLVTVAVLLVKKDPRGILLSVLFELVVIASMVWSIAQSRSSTAGVGFIFLPLVAALAGFFGLAVGRWRTSTYLGHRLGAWLALAGLVALVAINITGGVEARTVNRARDNQWTAESAEISHDRELIDAALKRNPTSQREFLDSSIRANRANRAFLLAALPHDSISSDLLDTLANSPDLGIALETIRNPATSAATLTRVYRTHSYPDYFFQALAAHLHTPPDILRNLHTKPGTISGLDVWLAANPSTPHDVLDDIAKKSTDKHVIAQLLENPSLDCGLLTELGVRLTKAPQRDPPDPNVMRATERLPDICLAKVKL